MATAIAQMILEIFANVAEWFQDIMTASDGMGFWLGCFLVWQVSSKLISPAVGGLGRGADTVSHSMVQRSNFRKAKKAYSKEV